MQLIINYGIDAVLLILLLLSIVSSMRKGFLKCVLSLICAVAALTVAASFNEAAAEWCYDNVLSEIVVSNVEKSINETADTENIGSVIEGVVETVPEFITIQLTKLGVDPLDLSERISQLQLSTEDAAEKISKEIIRPGVLVLLRLVLYLIIYWIVRFVLGLFSGFICKIADLPILKQVNKWLGAATGVFKGLLIIVSLTIIFSFCEELLKSTNVFALAIENSRICDIIEELIQNYHL